MVKITALSNRTLAVDCGCYAFQHSITFLCGLSKKVCGLKIKHTDVMFLKFLYVQCSVLFQSLEKSCCNDNLLDEAVLTCTHNVCFEQKY